MSWVEKVTIYPGAAQDIVINRHLQKRLGCKNLSQLTLVCGRSIKQASLGFDPGLKKGEIVLSHEMLSELHLPKQTLALHIFVDHNFHLTFGPVFGLLTECNPRHPENPLGHLHAFCQEMTRYAQKQHALFYVFSLKDWRTDFVSGYFWNLHHWERRKMPHPHVIYNRIHSRKLEESRPTQRFFQYLKDQRIPFFNERFLNKWEVTRILKSHRELSPYVPEAGCFQDADTIAKMIKKYPAVFLKPIHGSQGESIYRVKKMDRKLLITDSDGTKNIIHAKRDSLIALTQQIESKSKPYLIQQGLDLIQIDGRPTDFRILCGRTKAGLWRSLSSIARISHPDRFVSNIARGGKMVSMKEGLSSCFPKKMARQLEKTLRELALETVQILSAEIHGCFGELGVDLAVDHDGHPWIIEVNTKPSKQFDQKKTETIRPSAKAMIDFSFHLFFEGETLPADPL